MAQLTIQDALSVALQHHQRHRLQVAEQIYRQILAQQPNHARALHLLGVLTHQAGRSGGAVKLIGRAIALQPNYAEAFGDLGIVLNDQGRRDEAIAAFRQAIALKPGYPEAHNNLGNALKNKGQLDAAIAAYRQAIACNPGYPEAHNNLGNALAEKGRLDEAIAAYRQAIVLNPGYPEAHNNLGNALTAKGQLDEAIAAYRRAIAFKPDLPEVHSNLGFALRDLGRFEAASDSFRRALAIHPEARFYRALVSTGRAVAGSAEVERLKELAGDPGLAVEERLEAEFALGKLLDEAECFDEAFEHFAAGNRLFKESRAAAGQRFDGAELRRVVDRTIASFAPEFFASRRQWGDAAELPVFIVGMPRSGSSLVEQIAASHPAVVGAGELTRIQQLAGAMAGGRERSLGQGSGGAWPGSWDAQTIRKAAQAYLEHLRSLGGAAMRVSDKMPANVFHLGLIAVLFPRARVIFCRRDARDNCLSCYFERFEKNNLLYSYDLADCGRQYLETERLRAHWRKTLPLRMIEIQYEALVADQEAQSRRLVDFLGLPWAPACLEFHRTKRPVFTASAWQVRQPIYTRSVGRWRHYERYLGPLLEVLEGDRERTSADSRLARGEDQEV